MNAGVYVCVGVHLWAVTTSRPRRCKGLMGVVLIEIKIKRINLRRAFQSALMKEGLFLILNQNKIKIEIKKDQVKYPYLKNQRGKASRRKWDLSATEFPHHHPTLFTPFEFMRFPGLLPALSGVAMRTPRHHSRPQLNRPGCVRVVWRLRFNLKFNYLIN